MVPIGLVYSIHDSTEVAIQKMIDASQRMITMHSQVPGGASEGWGINPAIKKHLELEIKTLQNAPRDADKLRKLLEIKQRRKEEADPLEDTQRLVTEIEMLKVVFSLICRDNRIRKEEEEKESKKSSSVISAVKLLPFGKVTDRTAVFIQLLRKHFVLQVRILCHSII
jgi:hypothetical protein